MFGEQISNAFNQRRLILKAHTVDRANAGHVFHFHFG